MSDTMQSLDQLSQLKPATPEAPKYVKKVDKYGRAYATGKRKDAVARVWIKPGAGKIVVNTREVEIYFARPVLRMMIQQPLIAAARAGQYDVICTVTGGGLSGQAGAVRHGISKALTNFEPGFPPYPISFARRLDIHFSSTLPQAPEACAEKRAPYSALTCAVNSCFDCA